MEVEVDIAAAVAEEATAADMATKVDMTVRHTVELIYSLLRCFTEGGGGGYSTGGGSYQQGYGGYSQGY